MMITSLTTSEYAGGGDVGCGINLPTLPAPPLLLAGDSYSEEGSVWALPKMAVLGGGTKYSGISCAIRCDSSLSSSPASACCCCLGRSGSGMAKDVGGGGAGGVRSPWSRPAVGLAPELPALLAVGKSTDGTLSRLGEGGSTSRRSWRRRKGGVEKKEWGRDEGDGRSKEDEAVVADDVDAEVSAKTRRTLSDPSIFEDLGAARSGTGFLRTFSRLSVGPPVL